MHYFLSPVVGVWNLCGGKIGRGNPEASHVRNVDVSLVASPESFIVPELSYFGQHCFTGQSLAVNWELFFFFFGMKGLPVPRNLTCLSVFREIPGMSFARCTAVSLCQKSFLPASLGSHRAFLARLPWSEWLFLGTAHISFNSAVSLVCSPQISEFINRKTLLCQIPGRCMSPLPDLSGPSYQIQI